MMSFKTKKAAKKKERVFPNLARGIRDAWNVKDLRDKLIFTFLMLLLFRVGCNIPIPFISSDSLTSMFSGGSILSYMNLMSGGALASCALFALGVSPYINASIIMQLMCVCSDRLAEMQKGEDPEGMKKLNRITQYIGAAFSIVMSIGYYFVVRNMSALKYTSGAAGFMTALVIIALFFAGAQITVWIGGRIDDSGIGNGVSLLIFTGIISRWSNAYNITMNVLLRGTLISKWWFVAAPVIVVVLIAAILLVVFFDTAERRIPVQYAMKGGNTRKYDSSASSLPIKVLQTGVMPIIFSSAICSIPATIALFVNQTKHPGLYGALNSFTYTNWFYCVIYLSLILFFNKYYIEIQYDPIEMANNLRKNGGTIPGIRQGKPTSDYIKSQTNRVTLLGAFCLVLIAGLPMLVSNVLGISAQLGGTSLLIVVGVALEAERSMESYTVMRHHKGFLG